MADHNSLGRGLFDQVMVPNYAPGPIIPVKGKGSRVWDQDNKEYIDFAGGIAVTSLGHCHPVMVQAIQEQSQKLWHLSNVLANEPALTLAKKLTDLTFADKVFFCNSGAEANEAAFKLARRYGYERFGEHKNEIVACHRSFHGRTLFTVSVGGQLKYREGFEPTPGGILHGEFNNLDSIRELVSERTCAIVVEPIQGEGGIIPADLDFLKGLRALADQHRALLVFDEVQSGAGRTGYLYAYQGYDVVPDILTSAKGIGGGMPIGAMLTTDDYAKHLGLGTHGSTYGGNPLVCAVALAVVQEISKVSLLKGVVEKHQLMMKHLQSIVETFDVFTQARGSGLLLGLELSSDYQGRAKDFVESALKEGLLILVAGPNVLRFAPSLIIPDEDIIEGISRFRVAIENVVTG
jgi:acetylornithine/N-succinyldiaminopimelate aminotransferase